MFKCCYLLQTVTKLTNQFANVPVWSWSIVQKWTNGKYALKLIACKLIVYIVTSYM